MTKPIDGKVPCIECGKLTSPTERDSFHEMYGWSKYRGQIGGTNALKWKRSTGRILCKECGWQKEHNTQGQDSLF